VDAVGEPPNGAAVDNDTNVLYTPDPDFFGTDIFTYTVSDGNGGFGSATITVTVTNLNDPPVADAGMDQAVDTAVAVTLNGSGSSDPDGDLPLTYYWTQTGGPAVTLSDPAVVSPTFTSPSDPAVLTFTLSVTDSLGLADPTPDVVVITVNNQAPTAAAGSDQSVDTGATVTLDGSGSSDPDGDLPLSYHWSQTGGPAVALSDPTVVAPTFTAPGIPAVLTFTLAVTDSLGLADPTLDEVVITVEGYHIYLPLVVQQDESSAAQAEHTQQQTPATQVGFVSESGQPWLIPSVGSPLLLGLALWRKRQSKEFA
jgi:hypothetical protein